jgi:rubrerythrin
MANSQPGALQALRTAIQMEKDGKQYYQRMSKKSGNSLGKKLFQSLAAEEDLHLQKFTQIYQAIDSHREWPKVELVLQDRTELKTLFADAGLNIKPSTGELSDIQTAMDMENKTRDFYQQQAEKTASYIEKKYYQTLAGEESVHHALLQDYYEYLQDPAQYFTMKEHHSLDGG